MRWVRLLGVGVLLGLLLAVFVSVARSDEIRFEVVEGTYTIFTDPPEEVPYEYVRAYELAELGIVVSPSSPLPDGPYLFVVHHDGPGTLFGSYDLTKSFSVRGGHVVDSVSHQNDYAVGYNVGYADHGDSIAAVETTWTVISVMTAVGEAVNFTVDPVTVIGTPVEGPVSYLGQGTPIAVTLIVHPFFDAEQYTAHFHANFYSNCWEEQEVSLVMEGQGAESRLCPAGSAVDYGYQFLAYEGQVPEGTRYEWQINGHGVKSGIVHYAANDYYDTSNVWPVECSPQPSPSPSPSATQSPSPSPSPSATASSPTPSPSGSAPESPAPQPSGPPGDTSLDDSDHGEGFLNDWGSLFGHLKSIATEAEGKISELASQTMPVIGTGETPTIHNAIFSGLDVQTELVIDPWNSAINPVFGIVRDLLKFVIVVIFLLRTLKTIRGLAS